MRHVFPTNEVPHLWAHQSQDNARNAQGNLYFKGATIYSYRDSWPMARIYRNALNIALVLTNSGRYSSTTARHQWLVNSAVSHLRAITVPQPDIDAAYDAKPHARNLAYFESEMARLHKEAGRVRTVRGVEQRAQQAAALHKDMADYLIYFKIRRKMPALLSFADAYARANRIENPDPASKDKRERASAQRKQAVYARQRLAELAREFGPPDYSRMAARTDWRLGEPWEQAGGMWHLGAPTMLRVETDDDGAQQIETSQGARIPLDHAPRVWRLVQSVIAAGRPYVRNGHTEHAGQYPIDRVDVDGTMTAGCHKIPHSELRAMARALGLA